MTLAHYLAHTRYVENRKKRIYICESVRLVVIHLAFFSNFSEYSRLLYLSNVRTIHHMEKRTWYCPK
jgi:hypothetical protein